MLESFNNADLAFGAVAKGYECGLVTAAVMGGNGLFDTVKLDQHSPLLNPLLLNLHWFATCQEDTSACGDCRTRKLRIGGKFFRVVYRTIYANPVRL